MTSIAPVSPGEMLQEEFLKPLGLTPYRLAKDIDVPATRVYDIVSGKRAITAETDLLLCRYFGLSDGWWLAVQEYGNQSNGMVAPSLNGIDVPKWRWNFDHLNERERPR